MFRALSPFKVTKQILTEVWRLATNTWEGFHPRWMAEEDSHLIGCKIEFPQDYNNRSSINNGPYFSHSVENITTRDMDGEGPWWCIRKFLEPSRRNKYRLNGKPEKFQVSRTIVEVLEFFVNKEHGKLLQNFQNIVMDLTALWNRTKLRLFFGRVNHTARYSQLREQETLSQPEKFQVSRTTVEVLEFLVNKEHGKLLQNF